MNHVLEDVVREFTVWEFSSISQIRCYYYEDKEQENGCLGVDDAKDAKQSYDGEASNEGEERQSTASHPLRCF